MFADRTTRRVERIHSVIPMDAVLAAYGYRVQPNTDREQQFPCDLHGDGTDGKPSARVYPSTSQWYCFGCQTSRDAIATVREKENLSFHDAISKLEKDFGLTPLPWEDGDHEEKPTDEVAEVLDAPYVNPVGLRAERSIQAFTMERSQPLPRVLKMWEAFDRARMLEQGGDPEPMTSLLNVLKRVGSE